MKRFLILAIACSFTLFASGQKKQRADNNNVPAATVEQIDSTLSAIYSSYDSDRQQLQNQMKETQDTTFLKALNFQWNSLETKCANRMWGYLLQQPQSEMILQFMYRFRSSVDKEIVKKTMEQFKDKKLLQSKPGVALTTFVNSEQAVVGKPYKSIVVPAFGTEIPEFKLDDIVKQKSVLLIIGENEGDAIPDKFPIFYKKMDQSSVGVYQIFLYNSTEEAAEKFAEVKTDWPKYADTRGQYSPIVLDYNIQASPLCILIEKGSGKILYMDYGLSDDLFGTILTL